jgi:hypothetical protein
MFSHHDHKKKNKILYLLRILCIKIKSKKLDNTDGDGVITNDQRQLWVIDVLEYFQYIMLLKHVLFAKIFFFVW